MWFTAELNIEVEMMGTIVERFRGQEYTDVAMEMTGAARLRVSNTPPLPTK